MDWCRVVGPHILCRPLDEKQVSNKQPVRATRPANTGLGRRAKHRAGQGRRVRPSLRQHRRPAWNLSAWVWVPSLLPNGPERVPGIRQPGTAPDTPKKHSPNGREVNSGAAPLRSSYTGRLYPPSPSYANGQRRSREFRV